MRGLDTRREKDEKDLKDKRTKRTGAKNAAIKTALKSDVAKCAAFTISREPRKYAALSIDLRPKIEYNTRSNVL